MISRLGQAMPRFLAGANVAGEGLRERLRSTTFALFGLVTAVGLVLVGIAYNQGWPDFVDSPIPRHSDRAASARPGSPRTRSTASSPPATARASPGAAPAGTARPRSRPVVRSPRLLPATAPGDGAGWPCPGLGSVGAWWGRRARRLPPRRRPPQAAAQPAASRRPAAAGARPGPARTTPAAASPPTRRTVRPPATAKRKATKRATAP